MDHGDDAATRLAIKRKMNYNPGECLFWINIFEKHLHQCQEGRFQPNYINSASNCTLQKWFKALVYKNSFTK